MADSRRSRAGWGLVSPEAEVEASRQLAEAQAQNQPGMVEVLPGKIFLGWHPIVGRFTAMRRSDAAPAHLPLFMAMLDEAQHVHAPGESAEAAAEALVALFTHTAHQLAEQESD